MRSVFADTLYWVATVRPKDPWHIPAAAAGLAVGNRRIVTTDAVFNEFLATMASSTYLRTLAVSAVRMALLDETVLVVSQTRRLFLSALDLYENRPDKGYSLVDCLSMTVMRSMGIEDVLTNDAHFAQEGFRTLIQRPS